MIRREATIRCGLRPFHVLLEPSNFQVISDRSEPLWHFHWLPHLHLSDDSCSGLLPAVRIKVEPQGAEHPNRDVVGCGRLRRPPTTQSNFKPFNPQLRPSIPLKPSNHGSNLAIMDPHIQPYQYKPLPTGRCIRIILLYPSRDFDSPVLCSLKHISLGPSSNTWDPSKYDAISYVWGSSDRDHELVCDGGTIPLTQNCHKMLQYLRQPSRTRKIWVDAICIDQSSTTERNHQVALMGEVYKLAKRVLIWLGEGDAEAHRVIRRARWIGTWYPRITEDAGRFDLGYFS